MNRTMQQELSILDTLELETRDPKISPPQSEDAQMSKWNRARSKSRARKRGRSRHRESESEWFDDDDADLRDRDVFYNTEPEGEEYISEEERSHRDARIDAEHRAELLLRAGKMGFVVMLLLIFVSPLGVIALIFWGMKFGRRLFALLVEPQLRERLVEQEVGRNIHANVSQERREIADDHARSLEVLSASVAHEIRNPITAAKSLLQQMREDPESVDNEEYAQVALVELERVERSISHLLRFGREEEFRKAPVRMLDVLESAIETFRERGDREGVEIVREFDSDGTMLGDAEKLRRVMINLVGNAFDALTEAGIEAPTIHVSMGENLAGNKVWVRVRDNGHGIDEATRSRIFTPFYTDKRNGTGLGLAITRKLVAAHGGAIEVSEGPGEGAEFVLSFPKRPAGYGTATSKGDLS
ncbi:MAG: signal transduction histidine kinase [Myxococcota bacterium]|jgi:signal transduction histidine kinase